MRNFPPQFALALSSLFWAGNFIVGRALRNQAQPIALNFWRWTIALIIVLYFSRRVLRQQRRLLFRQWRLILAEKQGHPHRSPCPAAQRGKFHTNSINIPGLP
jgi:drug/metabolite transporter (DMT)-like permease